VCRTFGYGCIALAASVASSLCYRTLRYFGGEDSDLLVRRASCSGGHLDTMVYPATPNVTGTIASIPSAAFNIVGSFLLCSPAQFFGLAWDVAWVRT
jgi:hypothetical protein